MKKQIMSSKIVLAALALVLAGGTPALAITTEWVGVGGTTTTIGADVYGNWTSPANWTNGIGINASLDVFIGPVAANGGRVLMNSNADGFGANEFWVGGHNAAILPKIQSLTLSGGILQHTDGTVSQKNSRLGDGGTAVDQGIVKQTGGTFYMNKGELRIGANVAVGGNGLYDISGGTFSTAAGLFAGGNVVLGSRLNQFPAAFARGELRISGNATVDLGLPATAPQALGFGKGDGSYGSSVLSVIGSAATVNIDSIQMANGAPTFNSGLINFTFDQTGVSTIHVARSANLAQGFLNVDYTGLSLGYGDYFDLMVGDQITVNASFNLDPSDTTDWQLVKLGDGLAGGGTDTLRLIHIVPEPTTLTLLGVGLGAVLMVKRRRE